jgi:lipopolysaccharide export system permease protein
VEFGFKGHDVCLCNDQFVKFFPSCDKLFKMSTAFLFDRYVIKSLGLATLFTACTLAAIILLTQSLKFLELIIESGASSATFWVLAFLALPRFFEVILPIALMIAVTFVYSRMVSDSEIVVMRGAGASPTLMARPALVMAVGTLCLMFFITSWLAPTSLSSVQNLRQLIKTEYSALLFREGIFNKAGDDLTVFIEGRNTQGELEGLLIHDSRDALNAPVTIVAKRGVIVTTDEGQQVIVYNGSRQDFNKETGALNRLDFDRYLIDLPDPEAVGNRWQEPDERTLRELINTDYNDATNKKYEQQIFAEIHRRILTPFLPLSFTGVALCFLLLGPLNRRGQNSRIFFAVMWVVALQGFYLAAVNMGQKSDLGIGLMYCLVLVPILVSLFILSPFGGVARSFLMHFSKSGAINT